MFHCLKGNRHGVAECKGGEVAEAPLHMSGRDAGPKCKDNPIVLQRDAIVPIGFGPAALGPTRNGLPLRKRFLFQRALWVSVATGGSRVNHINHSCTSDRTVEGAPMRFALG